MTIVFISFVCIFTFLYKIYDPNLTLDDNNTSNEGIATALNEFFPSRSQDIFNEYNSETTNAKNAAQREEIKDELCDIFRPYGLMKLSCFY